MEAEATAHPATVVVGIRLRAAEAEVRATLAVVEGPAIRVAEAADTPVVGIANPSRWLLRSDELF